MSKRDYIAPSYCGVAGVRVTRFGPLREGEDRPHSQVDLDEFWAQIDRMFGKREKKEEPDESPMR